MFVRRYRRYLSSSITSLCFLNDHEVIFHKTEEHIRYLLDPTDQTEI